MAVFHSRGMFAVGQIRPGELTSVYFPAFGGLISERGVFGDFWQFARVHQRWLGQFSCCLKAATTGPVFARGANTP